MALTRPFSDTFFEQPFFGNQFAPWNLGRVTPQTTTAMTWKPSTDVRETENEILISAAIPGARREDVNVEVSGDTITLSGKVEEETKNETDRTYCVERSFGSFMRSFALPTNADTDKISAEHKDGVLYVKIPKTKEAKSETKRIGIKG